MKVNGGPHVAHPWYDIHYIFVLNETTKQHCNKFYVWLSTCETNYTYYLLICYKIVLTIEISYLGAWLTRRRMSHSRWSSCDPRTLTSVSRSPRCRSNRAYKLSPGVRIMSSRVRLHVDEFLSLFIHQPVAVLVVDCWRSWSLDCRRYHENHVVVSFRWQFLRSAL